MGLQDVWGPMVAWDLFLGGAGAAAYLVGVISERLGGRFARLAKPGIIAGPIMVALGALLLLLELGQPTRFYMGFNQPNSSIMSVGIILITLFIVLGILHIIFTLFNIGVKGGALKTWGTLTSVIGVGVMIYTGLLLAMVTAVPFWNTPLLPLLFFISALATGLATVMLIAGLQRWVSPQRVPAEEVGGAIKGLFPVLALLLVLEGLVWFLQLFVMSSGGVVASESANFLISGGYAVTFWAGVVVVGIVVPLLVWWISRKAAPSTLSDMAVLAAICVLAGGVMLRYSVVAAGASVASLM